MTDIDWGKYHSFADIINSGDFRPEDIVDAANCYPTSWGWPRCGAPELPVEPIIARLKEKYKIDFGLNF